jgi:hypothetical protein
MERSAHWARPRKGLRAIAVVNVQVDIKNAVAGVTGPRHAEATSL